MEETNAPFNRALWFTIGYFASILVEIIADELIRIVNNAAENYTTTEPLVQSENGNSGTGGETVTSLVKETTEDV